MTGGGKHAEHTIRLLRHWLLRRGLEVQKNKKPPWIAWRIVKLYGLQEPNALDTCKQAGRHHRGIIPA